jgi:hypothetical protein
MTEWPPNGNPSERPPIAFCHAKTHQQPHRWLKGPTAKTTTKKLSFHDVVS